MHQKLCANCTMFLNKKILMFQFIKLASSFNTFNKKKEQGRYFAVK